MRIPLTMLEEGQEGVVVAITPRARSFSLGSGFWGSFSRRFRWGWRRRGAAWGAGKRLADLGILAGTRIKVVRKAPFRGPIEIEVGGSRFMIGRGLAERILVEVKPVGNQPSLG
ncbi:MAG TPA: ferrous iron transport protein A [Nitrososphaeria archaeon]|nr:ferrous iron transport protein A [Nitrososphaeria archaeon]